MAVAYLSLLSTDNRSGFPFAFDGDGEHPEIQEERESLGAPGDLDAFQAFRARTPTATTQL